MSKRRAPPPPQAKTKKAKGQIQTRTQNLSQIENHVDAVEETENLDEETTLQQEVEEIQGGVYPATPHKRAQDVVDRGISPKQY